MGRLPSRAALATWLPVIVGLGILYVPSLADLIAGIWRTDAQMHGPIVLGIALWLFLYRNWSPMQLAAVGKSPSRWGWPVFAIGLFFYAVGRSQDILSFEVGSAVVLLAGILLLLYGKAALKAQWFALFFMLFMVPLPAAVVDAVTMPLKMAVSYGAEQVLFFAGYPIGRSGIILQIGQYKLLVADACAGLHTLLTLEALGLLYLNLVRRDSVFRNTALALLIVPISFTANVIRVVVLSLITYHFGDAAGQGFLHGFAGMVLFLSALMLIITADTGLQKVQALVVSHRTGNSQV
jgi:exosortase B